MRGTTGERSRATHASIVAAALLLAACGGGATDGGVGADPSTTPHGTDAAGGGGTDDRADGGETMAAAAYATLDLVDPAADYQAAGTGPVVAAVDEQGLDLDDWLGTNATGFAVIDYADGSVTRLDVNTEFRLVELGDGVEESQVRARLDVGRAWNRVEELSGAGRFEVETSVATAAVRGTTFLVECLIRFVCTFAVYDGEVEVTPNGGEPIVLTAGEQVRVDGDGPGPVEPVPARSPGDDPFTDRNEALDRGDPDPGGDPQAGSRAYVTLRKNFPGVGREGDVIPLTVVRSGFAIGPHPPNCDVWHLHSEGDGIFFADAGPFPEPEFSDAPGDGCGWGEVTNLTTEGPVDGGA